MGHIYTRRFRNLGITGIQNTKLPFKESFLQLAFENFELSYLTPTSNLTFLSLMICMEILFKPPDRRSFSEKIYKNSAVLLGKDLTESNTIFNNIKNLYDKRSELVHTGISTINTEDVLMLRNYVRKSIRDINLKDKNKNDLLEFLNS